MGRLPWRCLREVEMHGITPIRTDQVTTVLVLELVTGTGTAADVCAAAALHTCMPCQQWTVDSTDD